MKHPFTFHGKYGVNDLTVLDRAGHEIVTFKLSKPLTPAMTRLLAYYTIKKYARPLTILERVAYWLAFIKVRLEYYFS